MQQSERPPSDRQPAAIHLRRLVTLALPPYSGSHTLAHTVLCCCVTLLTRVLRIKQHHTELFTGNTMKLPAAIYEGKSTFGKLCHNWFWSYLGNFIGSLALVWMVVQSGVLAAAPGYAIKTAMAKGTLPWAQVGGWGVGRGASMLGRAGACWGARKGGGMLRFWEVQAC